MRPKWFTVVVLTALVLGIAPTSALGQRAAGNPVSTELTEGQILDKVDPVVLGELTERGEADYFIVLAEQADLSGADQLRTKDEKGTHVFDTLVTTAERTHAPLREYLDDVGVDYRAFYVANAILVRDGSYSVLLSLAARSDVDTILPNHEFRLQEPFEAELDPGQIASVQPNIAFIRAPDVWAMGYKGKATVLAATDTGLQWDHPAIIEQYRGWDGATVDHNYSWWDATGTYPNVPADGHGHGTHVTGTMVGDDGGTNQIGVAPGARTIHCKNMDDSGVGTDAMSIECFEWVLAPWKLDKTDPDPAMAPDAVNNSWGYLGGGHNLFRTIIQNLQAAGIVVGVAAGNEGSACGTLRSPGDYWEVLTTGSVNHTAPYPGTLTGFSSRGPSGLDPEYYIPDIMAPGEGIRSSVPGDLYASWGGTSMAAPHTVALVGLMWDACSVYRGLVYETIEIIQETAGPLTGQGGSNCGGDYTDGPNNDWGFGTMDALAAVNEIIRRCGPQGYLEGNIIDSTDLTPIGGATVTADRHAGGGWERTTDAAGYYTFTIPTGTYAVTVTHPHYATETAIDVAVFTETVTTRDFELHRPSIAVEPEKVEVQVPYGTAVYTHTTGLDVINDGGVELAFDLGGLSALMGVEGGIVRRSSSVGARAPSARDDGRGSSLSEKSSAAGLTSPVQSSRDDWIDAGASVPTAATHVPWFWPDPPSGIVAPLDRFNVDILFTARDEDKTPLPAGVYTATLLVAHNDPMRGAIHIPVTMHILEGPSLTIAVAGAGSGTVTPPEGTHYYPEGEMVIVTARAHVGSSFAGWSGAVESADETVVLQIWEDTAITATFRRDAYIICLPLIRNGVSPNAGNRSDRATTRLTARARLNR